MIYAIVGGVGSGKTVSAARKIAITKDKCFANFNTEAKNCTRLKKSHIIKENFIREKRNGDKVTELEINWKYWNRTRDKHKKFHIFLDEVHNLFHSRQAMKKWNILGTQWISQIRKILGQSEKTHIFLLTQKLSRLDVAFRDLLHGVTFCTKIIDEANQIKTRIVMNGKVIKKWISPVWIIQYNFTGEDCCEKFEAWFYGNAKTYDYRSYFLANPFFQFYDSYELLGESAYL